MARKGEQLGELVPCTGCKKLILWAKTPEGKLIPLDPVPATYAVTRSMMDEPNAVITDGKGPAPVFVTHFATCKAAGEFSGRSKR